MRSRRRGATLAGVTAWLIATTAVAAVVSALPATAGHTCFSVSGIHLSNSDDTWYGGPDDDTVSALAGNDFLTADGGADRLCGNEGSDLVYALDGRDQINGGWGFDDLFGGAATDTILGGEDNDRIRGEAGDDSPGYGQPGYYLQGNKGADTINGGDGWDAADGGPGTNDECWAEVRVNCERGGP